jgi:hypothetical protein
MVRRGRPWSHRSEVRRRRLSLVWTWGVSRPPYSHHKQINLAEVLRSFLLQRDRALPQSAADKVCSAITTVPETNQDQSRPTRGRLRRHSCCGGRRALWGVAQDGACLGASLPPRRSVGVGRSTVTPPTAKSASTVTHPPKPKRHPSSGTRHVATISVDRPFSNHAMDGKAERVVGSQGCPRRTNITQVSIHNVAKLAAPTRSRDPKQGPREFSLTGSRALPSKINHAVIITAERPSASHDTPKCRCSSIRSRRLSAAPPNPAARARSNGSGTILQVSTPSPQTAQPTQPQKSGPSPDTRYLSGATIIAAAIGAIGAIGVVVVSTWFAAGDSPTKIPTPPPSLEIKSVEWLGEDGRYEVRGSVKNLGDNHLIWTYNQPIPYEKRDQRDAYELRDSGLLYPDYGPCLVGENGNFSCNLGYAGSLEDDAGRPFVIWAAVVSDEDAYDAAAVKAKLDGRPAYANAVAVPHVDGAETMDSHPVIHPGHPGSRR